MSIKSFNDFLVENTKEVTFVFGRFNPPTIGHELVFEKLKNVARSGSYRIYASKTVDAKKNPLQFKDKIKFLRKMFPKHARSVMADKDVRTVFDILVKLYDQGFTKVNMVVGDDRLKEFTILLNKYNGKDGRHGFYNFQGINVVNAGMRDPDSDDATGMSASKMRAAAQQNDLKSFAKGLPSGFRDVSGLFNAVRNGMGLKESHTFRKHIELPPVSETREEYIEGSLFKVGDSVTIKETKEKGEIVVCGSNYVMVEGAESGARKRYWLDAVELNEEHGAGDWGTIKSVRNYLKDTPHSAVLHSPHNKTVAGNSPHIKSKHKEENKAYHKGLGKSTIAKRKAHFKKKSSEPAPGDARAKTKPSKHTKKFKAMFGEMAEHITFEDYMINEQDTDAALKKKADKSGMPLGILKQVFKRGVAAWKTGHRPGTTAVQWGLARVNSFVTKSSGTWGKADKDLAAKVRG
tara:strand:- start:203 stop:1588 length:1386 start_codon:yes stop_codon:yes gene_type:complete